MIKQRDFVITIILNIVTFGIYGLIFWFSWSEDVNRICESDGKNGEIGAKYVVCFLLSIVTFGIFSIIWMYTQNQRLHEISPDTVKGDVKSGAAILVWMIAGSFIIIGPLVAAYYMINGINIMGRMYNDQIAANNPGVTSSF